MIIESIFNPNNDDFDLQPLVISNSPMIDTLTFELSDLTERPTILLYTDPTIYALVLQFHNTSRYIYSPYKDLIRHVLQCTLLDINVYEHDLRKQFPELLI